MFFILTSIMLLLNTISINCKIRKEAKIDRFDICANGSKPTFVLHYVSIIYQESYGAYYNAKGEVLREIDSFHLKCTVDISRCANRESLDTCEYYRTITPPNVCYVLNMRGVAWESMVTSVDPPLRCPLRKTVYEAKNASFDPSLFYVFPLEGFYWRIRFNVFENQEFIGTVCFEGEVIKRNN